MNEGWRWRGRFALLALCVSVGVAYRVWLCLQPLHFGGDGRARYDPLARNLLAGHGFSRDKAPPYEPDAAQVPLYPVFLACVYWLTDYSTTAVVVVQVLMELFLIWLMMQWMRRLHRTTALIWIVVAAWLLVPLFAINVRICYTETLVTVLFTLACYFLTCLYDATPRSRRGYAAATGICIALATLTRAEMLICLTLVAGYAFMTIPRAALLGKIQLAAVTSLASVVVVGPWCVRDYQLFGSLGIPGHRQFGLGDSGEREYSRWVTTWWDDPIWVTPYGFEVLTDGPSQFPRSHMRDAEEAEQADYALSVARRQGDFEGEPRIIFGRLADRALARHFWRIKLLLPIQRAAATWVRMPANLYLPAPLQRVAKLACYGLWLFILWGAAYGAFDCFRRRDRACILLLVAIGSRTLMPLVSAQGLEPRYLSVALPSVFILWGIGIASIASSFARGATPAVDAETHPERPPAFAPDGGAVAE